jgi:hypothetical protein
MDRVTAPPAVRGLVRPGGPRRPRARGRAVRAIGVLGDREARPTSRRRSVRDRRAQGVLAARTRGAGRAGCIASPCAPRSPRHAAAATAARRRACPRRRPGACGGAGPCGTSEPAHVGWADDHGMAARTGRCSTACRRASGAALTLRYVHDLPDDAIAWALAAAAPAPCAPLLSRGREALRSLQPGRSPHDPDRRRAPRRARAPARRRADRRRGGGPCSRPPTARPPRRSWRLAAAVATATALVGSRPWPRFPTPSGARRRCR